MPDSTSIKSIAAAIADELQLSSTELLSVTQITVSVTYKVDRQDEDDWMDDWYRQYTDKELVPF